MHERPDVQNIDLMILAGFCRNCLADWYREAASAHGITMTKDEAREAVYGEPFGEWKAEHQRDATPEQLAAFERAQKRWSSPAYVDVVEKVAPAAGDVMSTVGATPSVRVTVRTSVPTRPAASRAVTVITVAPTSSGMLVAVHAVVPEATPDAPLSVDQLTCVTPNASLAVPPSASVADAVEKVVAAVGVAIEIVGAVPSVMVTVAAALPALPAASLAVTVMTLAPGLSGTEADQAVVPDAVPLPPWLFDQVTCMTPTRSAATPVNVTVLLVVEGEGVAIDTVGATTSESVTASSLLV